MISFIIKNVISINHMPLMYTQHKKTRDNAISRQLSDCTPQERKLPNISLADFLKRLDVVNSKQEKGGYGVPLGSWLLQVSMQCSCTGWDCPCPFPCNRGQIRIQFAFSNPPAEKENQLILHLI